MELEDYKNEIEMLRQSFAQGRTDEEIHMPDAEAELIHFMAEHENHFEHRTVRLTLIRKMTAVFLGILMLSGLGYAAIRTSFFTQPWREEHATDQTVMVEMPPSSLLILPNDSVQKPTGVITFDNQELADVLKSICNTYKVEIQFKNEEQKHIRLHFSYDTEESLRDVMESLNIFEKFRLELKGKKLSVE